MHAILLSAIAAASRRHTALPPNGLLNNLLAYWKQDEASGTAIDAHGSYDLTDANSDVGQDTSTKILGTGARRVITAAAATRLTGPTTISDFNVPSFTITGWFRADAVDGNYRYIIAKNDLSVYGNAGFFLRYQNAVGLEFGCSNTYWGNYISVLKPISAATWYFFACGNNSTQNWISLNAGSRTVASQTSKFANASPVTLFAAHDVTSANEVHQGHIDEVGFYARDLSSDDITMLYNSGAGFAYENFTA